MKTEITFADHLPAAGAEMHREGTLRRLFAQVATYNFAEVFGEQFDKPLGGTRGVYLTLAVAEEDAPNTQPPSILMKLTASAETFP